MYFVIENKQFQKYGKLGEKMIRLQIWKREDIIEGWGDATLFQDALYFSFSLLKDYLIAREKDLILY